MNKILLLLFAVFLHTALLAQTIAFWDFNANPGDAAPATGTNTPALLQYLSNLHLSQLSQQ